MSDMNDVTRNLGESYENWKTWEKAKNKAKDRFFKAATDSLSEETPGQWIKEVEAVDKEEALRIAQRRFQRHSVADVTEVEEGKWSIILEEDPALKEFTWVNREDGKVYQRIVAEGGPILDDQSLRDEQPGLWDAITNEVTRRELKPLDELTPEQAAALQPYLAMPKPQPRLMAPRKAKEEEIEDDNRP